MPGAAVDKSDEIVPDILINQPVYMNYGRVALDALMAVILIFVITSDPVAKSDLDNKQFLHVHEVPIYIKHDIPVGDIWAKAQLATGLKTDEEKLAEFKKHLAVECLTIDSTHCASALRILVPQPYKPKTVCCRIHSRP